MEIINTFQRRGPIDLLRYVYKFVDIDTKLIMLTSKYSLLNTNDMPTPFAKSDWYYYDDSNRNFYRSFTTIKQLQNIYNSIVNKLAVWNDTNRSFVLHKNIKDTLKFRERSCNAITIKTNNVRKYTRTSLSPEESYLIWALNTIRTDFIYIPDTCISGLKPNSWIIEKYQRVYKRIALLFQLLNSFDNEAPEFNYLIKKVLLSCISATIIYKNNKNEAFLNILKKKNQIAFKKIIKVEVIKHQRKVLKNNKERIAKERKIERARIAKERQFEKAEKIKLQTEVKLMRQEEKEQRKLLKLNKKRNIS